MNIKPKSVILTVCLAMLSCFLLIGCAGTDHSTDVKTHEMGGPKPSFTMQDKDMPGRTN